ncbi:hypothetical protein Pint_02001 [Pistacia integerrima]|uniref:Uncharacterized protein n=1 Tax=Pistacia integerrima TaxID=434235 RepID=A0ACC0ZFJ7_9ROSI|nr:hypothetical protein Pint_02001 [Pistacia integerrima]
MTTDLSNLSIHSEYDGTDEVVIGDGSGSDHGETLLKGDCEDGVYPLPESLAKVSKKVVAYVHERTTTDGWHKRLGHPSSKIVNHVIRNFLFEKSSSLNREALSLRSPENHSHVQISLPKVPSPLAISMIPTMGTFTDHSPLVASSLALTPSQVNVSPSYPLIAQEISSFSIPEIHESAHIQTESVMPSPVDLRIHTMEDAEDLSQSQLKQQISNKSIQQ